MASLRGYARPTKQVSERMRRVRSRGTALEKEMERLLKEAGLVFERQPRLPGRPDFRLRGTNVVLFCDSSFWHGRRERDTSGRSFGRNRSFWVKKLVENRRRDLRTNRTLRREGWSVHRFWDTDVLSEPERVKNRLRRIAQ